MSTVRKVLRLFRTLAVLRALHRSLPSSSADVTLELLFNLSAKLCLAAYFLLDHLMYAQRIGMYNPDPTTLKALNQATEGSWLGEVSFNILEQLAKLYSLHQQVQPIGVAVVGGVGVGSLITGTLVASSVAWEETRAQALRALLRNALDLPIAMHFLSFEWTTHYGHGWFGALGVLSSLMSLYDMWPSGDSGTDETSGVRG